MSKKTYTAVFHPESEAGGYSISFPDLPGCYTQGNDIDEALRMAADALGLYLYTLKEDKMPFPPASHPSDIKTEGRDFTTLITWDEAEYLRRIDSRAVKKNAHHSRVDGRPRQRTSSQLFTNSPGRTPSETRRKSMNNSFPFLSKK